MLFHSIFKKFLPAVFALTLFCLPIEMARAVASGTAHVLVKVTGLRSAKGKEQIRLWASKDGFPSNEAKAFRRATVEIGNGEASAEFLNVPYGEYAVATYHDENGNGKFDTRFPGIPTEGYGISNDVRGRFGPPPFEPARIPIRTPECVVAIITRY